MIYPDEYIVWDLETSGFDPKECRILEIGAMHIRGDEVLEERSWILNNHIEVPEKIVEITGITQEIVDAGVPAKEAIDEFLQWFERTSWANLTHNGFKFDMPFLLEALTRDSTFNHEEREVIKGELYRNGVDSAAMYKGRALKTKQGDDELFMHYAKRVLDTRAYGVKFNVGHCCDDLGIDRSAVQQHRALGDVMLTNLIYRGLVHENQ